MQVGKLGLNQMAAAFFGPKQEQSGAASVASGDSPASAAADTSPATNITYRQILANYDVTNITPRQYSQLIHELHAAGAINDADLQELSGVRFELDRAEYDPDEPVNLVELFQKRLDNLLQAAKDAATDREDSDLPPEERAQILAQTKRQIDWLKKFATVHAESTTPAVNTLV
jgi:hypothetical protein